MAKELADSKQLEYSANMMSLLAESKGAYLRKYCEAEVGIEAESNIFYRKKASTTKTSVNGYSATPNNTSGQMVKLTVTPTVKYSDLNLTYLELVNTKLDLKSNFMASMVSVLENEEDLTILASIDANVNISTGGDAANYISTDTNMDTLIKTIAYAKALAKGNAEHGMDVAIALSREDYAEIFKSEKFTNMDWSKVSGNFNDILGADLLPIEGITAGEVYVIPNQTVCFTSLKNGDQAQSEYLLPKDEYYLQAKKSFGSGVFDLEAPYITKLTFKDPTT